MAGPIVQAVYDLVDKTTAKLKVISDALRGNRAESDKTAGAIERNNARTSDSYKKAADGIGTVRKALLALGALVGLDKVKDTLVGILNVGEQFDDLGKKFATAFGGLTEGSVALEKVRTIAAGVPQSFEDVSAAAIKLKQAGFEPLDGTLQVLLDNANALDQSQEDLIATIDALGKASIRGEVNMKALVALTQQGVPVFELLGKAMNISADRVRELAESGKLGQDSIRLLVTELGKLRAGASVDELGDIDAQITKLKDSIREFALEIANSGSLEFFRKQLADLNAQITDAAKSGRLQQIAKNISDGIVTGAKAIGAAAKFIYDHAAAITTLGKAYLAFKASDLLLNLAKTGAGLLDTTGKAKGLGGALGKIPTNVRVAIALIGIDLAIAAGEKLGDIISENSAETAKWQKVQEGFQDQIRANAFGFADIAAKLSAYREQTVLGAKDVANLSEAERASYAERLAGLQKYLQAQILYLTNLQRAGLAGKEEVDRLAEMKAALEAAKNGQLAFAEGTKAAADAIANNLTPGAQLLANRLEEVGNDAKAAGDTVSKAFDGFDLKRRIGDVGEFALAFDFVAAKGGKAAETLNTTLLESLKKLGGEDLLRFQSGATQAIEAVGAAGTETSAILKATLEAALDHLGVKAEDTGVAITKTGQDILATFNTIAQNAQASAQTISAAFDAALLGTKTIEEAKAIGEALKAAGAQGKIGFKDLADAGREVDERIRTITASISPLKSQFDLLGIKSQAQLIALRDNARDAFDAVVDGARRGNAAQEDVVRAFRAYADAARAAAADSSADNKARVEEQLALQASVLGVTDALGKAGTAGQDAGAKTAKAFDGAKDSIDDTADAADNLASNATAGVAGVGAAAQQTAATIATATQGIVLLTAEQLTGLRQIGQELAAGGLTLQQYEERVQEVMTGTSAAIERQIDQLKRFNNAVLDLQAQLAQERGDPDAVEEARHKKALEDIKEKATLDGELNGQQYNELKRLEEQIHQQRLKNIEAEKRAKRDTDTTGTDTGSGGGGGGVPSPTPAPTPRAPQPIVNVTPNVLLLSGDRNAIKQLSQLIARDVKSEIDAIVKRSR